mmetsp:Transcript_5488/g.9300  ORF Transcript_5488/g.9300 Transcript_5488/m.9300 type:complete len:107 (-) Transcript_5488:884-1204(-)
MMEEADPSSESQKKPVLSIALAILVSLIYGFVNFIYASLSSSLGIDAVFLLSLPMIFQGVFFHIYKMVRIRFDGLDTPYFTKDSSSYYVREEIAVPTDPEKLDTQA